MTKLQLGKKKEKSDAAKMAAADDVALPHPNVTRIYYKSSFFASIELNKWMDKIFRGGPCPVQGVWPRYYLAGAKRIGYPDVAGYRPKHHHYGPGLYCYAPTQDPANVIGPLILGQNDKERDANFSVALLELLNPAEVFGAKVKQLCSDWEPRGDVMSRTVSTDGMLYVFHPRVANLRRLVSDVKLAVSKVEQFREFSGFLVFIKNDLSALEDLIERQAEVERALDALEQQVEAAIERLDFGLFWSRSRPDMLREMLRVCTAYLKANDENVDFELLGGLKKRLPAVIAKREESEDLRAQVVALAENVVRNYESAICASESAELYRYEVVRELSYRRATVSALKLAVQGFRNNIESKEQAKFKILHFFVFEKNKDERVSLMGSDPFKKQSAFAHFKGSHYDGFRFVEPE